MHCLNLNSHALLSFIGPDAGSFLANLLTCDVAGLAANRSTYGAYCTPKGRMLVNFLLWRSKQGYFMQLPSSLREAIQKQLSKYVLRSKVKIADASPDWTMLGVSGSDAAAAIQHAVGQAPQGVRDVAQTALGTVIRLPGDRFLIAVPKDKASQVLESLPTHAGEIDAEHWDWMDIRSGIPTILPATQEAFVPQMVNLDLLGGVSFEKGCYPGQEIVARMHYRGTLKQRMYLAHVAGTEAPQPGDKLYSPDFGDQASGTIVNAAHSSDGGFDALAVIQITSAAKGGIRWKSIDGPGLELLPLPYAVPTSE